MDKKDDLEIIEDLDPTIDQPEQVQDNALVTQIEQSVNTDLNSTDVLQPISEHNINQSVENSEHSFINPEVEPPRMVEIGETTNESAVSNEEVKKDEVTKPAVEMLGIDEGNKKPEIIKEQVVTEKQKEEKHSKASMTLVIVILLILILFVLFLPQISEMLS